MGIGTLVDFFYKLFCFVRNLLFPGRQARIRSPLRARTEQKSPFHGLLRIVRLLYLPDYSADRLHMTGLPLRQRIFFSLCSLLVIVMLMQPAPGSRAALYLFGLAFGLAVALFLFGLLRFHALAFAAAAFVFLFSFIFFDSPISGRLRAITLLAVALLAAYLLAAAARGICGLLSALIIAFSGAFCLSLLFPRPERGWIFWVLLATLAPVSAILPRKNPPFRDRLYPFWLLWAPLLLLFGLFAWRTAPGGAWETIDQYSRWLVPNLWPLWYYLGARFVLGAIQNGRILADALGEMLSRHFPWAVLAALALAAAAAPFFEPLAAHLKLGDTLYFALKACRPLAALSLVFLLAAALFAEEWKKRAPAVFLANTTALLFIYGALAQSMSLGRYFEKPSRFLSVSFALVAVFFIFGVGVGLIKKAIAASASGLSLLLGTLLLIAALCYGNARSGGFNVVPAIFYFNFLGVVHLSVPLLLLVLARRFLPDDEEMRKKTIRIFLCSFFLAGPLIPVLKKVLLFKGDLPRLWTILKRLATAYEPFPAIPDWRIDIAVLLSLAVFVFVLFVRWRRLGDWTAFLGTVAATLGLITWNLYLFTFPAVPETVLKLVNPGKTILFFSTDFFLTYFTFLLPPFVLYFSRRIHAGWLGHAAFFCVTAAAEMALVALFYHPVLGGAVLRPVLGLGLLAMAFALYRETARRNGRPVLHSTVAAAGLAGLFLLLQIARALP